MKWGVQQVRVTLESDSGETLVVEQRPDGSVVCEPASKDKSAGKATPKPAEPPKAEKPPAKAKADEPAKAPKADKPPTRAPKADKPPTRAPKADKPPTRAPKAKPAKPAKPGKLAVKQPRAAAAGESLDWHEFTDSGYTGIGALVRHGVYKALRAKTAATYALFFETVNQPPHHIGCFRTLDDVKKRAQQIHDSGWPPHRSVTTAEVEGACPAPTAPPTAEPKPARGRKPTSAKAPDPAEQPPAAQPEPATTAPSNTAAAPSTETGDEEELMRSLTAALVASIPEEDD